MADPNKHEIPFPQIPKDQIPKELVDYLKALEDAIRDLDYWIRVVWHPTQ